VNEHQIVLAAEVTASSPDFGHLQPMVEATKKELEAIGVTETPGVAVADSGYWNEEQIDNVVGDGTQVLIPPDAGKRDTPRPGWDGGRYTWMRNVLATNYAGGLQTTKGDGRASLRTNQAQPPDRPLPTTRTIRRALRMATHHRHTQPDEAPQAPNSRRRGLKRPPRRHHAAKQHQQPDQHRPRTGRATAATMPPRPRPFARHPPRGAVV
jgi:hypothetical protein